MNRSLQVGSTKLAIIAHTGDRFSDFTPYVAAINDRGVVAFQAALRNGGSGHPSRRKGRMKSTAGQPCR